LWKKKNLTARSQRIGDIIDGLLQKLPRILEKEVLVMTNIILLERCQINYMILAVIYLK